MCENTDGDDLAQGSAGSVESGMRESMRVVQELQTIGEDAVYHGEILKRNELVGQGSEISYSRRRRQDSGIPSQQQAPPVEYALLDPPHDRICYFRLHQFLPGQWRICRSANMLHALASD